MSWLKGLCLALLYETVPTNPEAAPNQKSGSMEERKAWSFLLWVLGNDGQPSHLENKAL